MSWKQEARDFAASVAEWTSVAARETELTDRLIEFSFDPPDGDAAPISLVISEDGVIFGAGRGTHMELDGLSKGADEVERLVRAVVAGGLRETVNRGSVRFVLRLEGGSKVAGGMNSYASRSDRGVIDYGRYPRSST